MEGDEYDEYESDVLLGEQPNGPLKQEGGDTLLCWSGRAVVNDRLMVVEFDDGTSGMVRKHRDFKPKRGLVMEVRHSEESGFYELVGEYRKNGVRLDK